MTANEIFFGLITAAIVALVIFAIWLIFRTVETLRATNKFLETADRTLQEATGQLNQNLKSLESITENLNTMTNDLKSFSSSVKDAGDGVRQATESAKRIGDVVQGIATETLASVQGFRVGLKTGFEVFLKNLLHGVTR
jgi:uncharacterized protein YoxC